MRVGGVATGKHLGLFLVMLCVNFTGGGVDYDSGPYAAKFLAGQVSTLFQIPINDDNTLEDNENFTLTIDISSLPNGVTVGDPVNTTVIIVDDDGKVILFIRVVFIAYTVIFTKSREHISVHVPEHSHRSGALRTQQPNLIGSML